MTNQIKNVTVLESGIWEAMTNVTVNKVNIVQDQSLQYQLVPTKEHAFMNKIGFSKYIFKGWVKKIEVLTDGTVQLYDYNLHPSFRLELSEDQVNEWKEMDSLIEFTYSN